MGRLQATAQKPDEQEQDQEQDQGQEQGQGPEEKQHSDQDMGDLLQELRILLQGSQVLTAFLIILPFNQGFEKIDDFEKWVYIGTFICSVISLVLFSAPAAQHRLIRPIRNRPRFKNFATRMTIMGLIPASLALVGVTHLVTSTAIGNEVALAVTLAVAVIIALLWWIIPLARRHEM
jgi:hypothetical protein